jgi:pimeloyl-ACP methyl ester carboxylesterase
VLRSARSQIFTVVAFTAFLGMITAAIPAFAGDGPTAKPAVEVATDGAVRSGSAAVPSSIVIGFVGGFVRHDNPHHGPVFLARSIQRSVPKDTYVQVFENRHRRSAYTTILRLLDRDHDGKLSAAEKSAARIVLFGQSWGASAVVMLARELDRIGVPVLLTVQVDSVAKLWQDDGVIPDNVAAAANFYQPHGLLHGRHEISAADPAKTQILGNYLYDYRKNPVQCDSASWADRFFTPGHMQSECDPHLWGRVEDLVHQRIEPALGVAAIHPQQ